MTDLPLATLTVDPDTVKSRLDGYRLAAKETRLAEDRLLAHAYYQASRGRQIISLAETVQAGGLDARGLPRIAVSRAISERIEVHMDGGRVAFRDERSQTSWWSMRGDVGWWHVSVPWPDPDRKWAGHGYTALVPNIPPEHRPRAHKRSTSWLQRIGNYHLLWEATWERTRPRAPRDPALIRHIAGDLWVVMATWDLSELERAVLFGVRGR